MAGRPPAGSGKASMRRAGGLQESDVVGTFDDPQATAAAKRRDAAAGQAYKQGQGAARRRVQETGRTRGHQPAHVHDDPAHQELYEAGFGDELGDQRRTKRAKQLAPVRKSAGGVAHDGAGLVLGMVGYALFLAYVKGGWPGVTGWLGAKFLNRTKTAAVPATPQPGPSAGRQAPTTFDPTSGNIPPVPVPRPGGGYNPTLPG